MTQRQTKFIQHAMSLANKSPILMRHGCVITRGGKIVSEGYNHYHGGITPPSYLRKSMTNHVYNRLCTSYKSQCSCHAEIHAIHQLLRRQHKEQSTCKLS